MSRDHVDKGGDSKSCLESDKVNKSSGALLCVPGESGENLSSSRISPKGQDGTECRNGQDSVIKLDKAGVFKHVAPPKIRAILLARVEFVEQLGLGRSVTKTHLGELVVDETSIEASDQGAGHGSEENEAGDAKHRAPESVEDGVLNCLDGSSSGGGVGEHTTGAEDGNTRHKHPGVADESSSQMSSQPVLRDTRV